MKQESSDEKQDDGTTGGGVSSGGRHGGGLLSCTFGSSAQYTGPDSTGCYFIALKFALTAAYPPPITCSPRFFQIDPWIDCLDCDSASSAYMTDPSKFVYNKRRPLPAEAFLLTDDGRKLKVECFGSLNIVWHCKDDVRVTLENVAVVPALALNLIILTALRGSTTSS